MSQCGVAKALYKQKIKPRKAKEWSQPTIGFIIKSHKDQTQKTLGVKNG